MTATLLYSPVILICRILAREETIFVKILGSFEFFCVLRGPKLRDFGQFVVL